MQGYQPIVRCTQSWEKKPFGDQEADRGSGRTALRSCPDESRVILRAAKVRELRVEQPVLEAEAPLGCHLQAGEPKAQEAEKILQNGKDTILTLCKLPNREQNAD